MPNPAVSSVNSRPNTHFIDDYKEPVFSSDNRVFTLSYLDGTTTKTLKVAAALFTNSEALKKDSKVTMENLLNAARTHELAVWKGEATIRAVWTPKPSTTLN